MSQGKSMQDLLGKFDLNNFKPVAIRMECGKKFHNLFSEEDMNKNPYCGLIGSLIYVAVTN